MMIDFQDKLDYRGPEGVSGVLGDPGNGKNSNFAMVAVFIVNTILGSAGSLPV